MSHRTAPANVSIPLLNNDSSKKLAPKSGSNGLEVNSDYGIWDTVANKTINVENTNFNENK